MTSQDKILIKDLLLRGIIGLNDWEREKRQDILINMTLFTDLRAAGKSDDIGDTLNYRTIAKLIIQYVEEGSAHYTVEALATALARIAIEGGAPRVVVRVEKPGALRFADSVGVEIERTREDFGLSA
jgi:FolB domain-containing protein